MTEATPNPRAVTCQFCGGEFDQQGRLALHERRCEKQTPEQRKKASAARHTYRTHYSIAANGASKRAGETAQRYVDRIKANNKKPRLTDEEQRHQRKLETQRRYYAKYGRGGKNAQLEREVKKASILLDGKRVQVTLSLDWDTLRTLLIQLAPDISIDKVELVS